MTELEIGRTYSTKELSEAIGVSYSTFRRQKNKLLNSISMAYNYKIGYKGRGTFYTITKKIGDYQKPERKNARSKVDEVIQQFINDTIDEDPCQTAASISRRALEHSSAIAALGLTKSTVEEYIRINLRKMYGTKELEGGTDGMIERKALCKLDREHNRYEELPEHRDIDMDIVNNYKNGLLTRGECLRKLESHEEYCISVPVYVKYRR